MTPHQQLRGSFTRPHNTPRQSLSRDPCDDMMAVCTHVCARACVHGRRNALRLRCLRHTRRHGETCLISFSGTMPCSHEDKGAACRASGVAEGFLFFCFLFYSKSTRRLCGLSAQARLIQQIRCRVHQPRAHNMVSARTLFESVHIHSYPSATRPPSRW